MLLTPLKIEFLPYFGVFVYSLFIMVIYELFTFLVKKYM